MDQYGNAQICDYGLLSLIRQVGFAGEQAVSTSLTNTARYTAPELVKDEQSPTLASDIYALGCIGYEVCVQ